MLNEHLFIKTDGMANPNNLIFYKNYRITLLFDSLIRIERNDKEFLDLPTSAFIFRNFDDVKHQFEVLNDGILITTKTCKIFIGDDFDSSYCILNDSKIKLDNKNNLLSTCKGLDGCTGPINDHYSKDPVALILEPGVCSRDGVAVIDDSKSMYLDKDGLFKESKEERFDKYIFMYGNDYQKAIKAFYKVSGNVPLIPRYALGNWWSRYHIYHDDEYLRLMHKFINYKIPLTVATVDTDWHPSNDILDYYKIKELGRDKLEYGFDYNLPEWRWGWTGYSWDLDRFKNPKSFLSQLHKLGLKVTLNVHPNTICWYEKRYKEFVNDLNGDPNLLKPYPLDFNNVDFINSYFKNLNKPLEDEGVDFWWIDEVSDIFKYAHYYYLDNSKNHYPLILNRYAGLGSQRYPLGFSGDSVICWESLDYLPYFTANSSNIGYSWWSHDIGAFMEGVKDDELYIRYVELGVFLPIMRLHCQQNDMLTKEPWEYKNGIGDIAIKQLRYRHRMIPFLYSGTYRNTYDLKALIEPMYYYYPNDERAYKYKNQYFFNEQLLVCPITSKSKNRISKMKIFLPKGKWTDIFTNDIYEGNKEINVVRTLDSIPVFAKEGGIFVLANNKTNSNSISNPKSLEVNIYNGNGSFTLYEDNDLKNQSFTYFISSLKGNIQTLKITFKDQGAIPSDRKMNICFKNIFKGKVTSNEKFKINKENVDFVEVLLTNIDVNKEYIINVKIAKEEKLEVIKREALAHLKSFEGINVDKVTLYEKILKANNIKEYIKAVNESSLNRIYKDKLKELK